MGICTSSKDKSKDKDKSQDKDKAKTDPNPDPNPKDPKDNTKEITKTKSVPGKSATHDPSIKSINIKFLSKGEDLFTIQINTSELINHLFEVINDKMNKYSDYDLLTETGESLSDNTGKIIYEIFPSTTDCEIQVLYLGLDISRDVRKDYEIKTTIIGTLLLDLGDSVGVAVFNKFNQQVTHKLLTNQDLLKFNHLSSYCNGNNSLYISGGEAANPNEALSDFYAIDLFSLEKVEQLPMLNVARAWHSMLFIPPKYVIIVGGTVKSVELYDIEKKTIIVDSELNEVRGESTLCCVNDAIVYCFCGFIVNDSHLNTVEKCNMRKAKRVWEYVTYTTDDNVLFEQCFYVCSYFGSNSLILFGTNENSKVKMQNILFDFEDEENCVISLYQPDKNEGRICDVCPEKFFHPINEKSMIMFPLTSSIVKLYRFEDVKLSCKNYPDILNEILN